MCVRVPVHATQFTLVWMFIFMFSLKPHKIESFNFLTFHSIFLAFKNLFINITLECQLS